MIFKGPFQPKSFYDWFYLSIHEAAWNVRLGPRQKDGESLPLLPSCESSWLDWVHVEFKHLLPVLGVMVLRCYLMLNVKVFTPSNPCSTCQLSLTFLTQPVLPGGLNLSCRFLTGDTLFLYQELEFQTWVGDPRRQCFCPWQHKSEILFVDPEEDFQRWKC